MQRSGLGFGFLLHCHSVLQALHEALANLALHEALANLEHITITLHTILAPNHQRKVMDTS